MSSVFGRRAAPKGKVGAAPTPEIADPGNATFPRLADGWTTFGTGNEWGTEYDWNAPGQPDDPSYGPAFGDASNLTGTGKNRLFARQTMPALTVENVRKQIAALTGMIATRRTELREDSDSLTALVQKRAELVKLLRTMRAGGFKGAGFGGGVSFRTTTPFVIHGTTFPVGTVFTLVKRVRDGRTVWDYRTPNGGHGQTALPKGAKIPGPSFGSGFPAVDEPLTAAILDYSRAWQAEAMQPPPTSVADEDAEQAEDAIVALSDAIVALQSAGAQLAATAPGTDQGGRYRHQRLVDAAAQLNDQFFYGAKDGDGSELDWTTIMPELPGTSGGGVAVFGGAARTFSGDDLDGRAADAWAATKRHAATVRKHAVAAKRATVKWAKIANKYRRAIQAAADAGDWQTVKTLKREAVKVKGELVKAHAQYKAVLREANATAVGGPAVQPPGWLQGGGGYAKAVQGGKLRVWGGNHRWWLDFMPDGSWGYADAMPLGRFRSASSAMKSPAAQRTAFGGRGALRDLPEKTLRARANTDATDSDTLFRLAEASKQAGRTREQHARVELALRAMWAQSAVGAAPVKPAPAPAKPLTHVPVQAGNAGTILLPVASVLTAADVLDLAASLSEAAASVQQRAFEWESQRQGLPQLPGQEIMRQLASNDLVQPGGGFVFGGVGGSTVKDNHGREWGPRRGLEGPFRYRSGRVLYYDKREKGGTYYDPSTDHYLTHDEAYRIHTATSVFGGLETDAAEVGVSGQDLRYASRARVGLDNDQKWAEGQGRWGDANENIKVGALLRRGD